MNEQWLSIGETAQILQVSIDTLRRWDEKGILKPSRLTPASPRRYKEDEVYNLLLRNDLLSLARSWVSADHLPALPEVYYCATRDIFQARLESFRIQLNNLSASQERTPLITSIAGEIGNNSFDHNIGAWPDTPGVFFGYDTNRQQIVLADRGQGVLTTLKRVRPELTAHETALKMAFTEILSGRAPEARGNGLKFVKKYAIQLSMDLFFQTGNAVVHLKKNDAELHLQTVSDTIHGCLAILTY